MTTIACCSCGTVLEIKPSLRRLYRLGIAPVRCAICRQLNTWNVNNQRNWPLFEVKATSQFDEKSGQRFPNPARYRMPLKGL